MKKKYKDQYERFIFILLFLVVIISSYLLLSPYIISILTSLLLGYIFYPLYIRFRKWIGHEGLASLVMVILVLLILMLPIALLVTAVTTKAGDGYLLAKETIFEQINCNNQSSLICKGIIYADTMGLTATLSNIFKAFGDFILTQVSSILLRVPVFLLNIFIIIFILYYIFKDGSRFMEYIFNTLSMKISHRKVIIEKISSTTYAVIYGHFLTAVLQGILGGFGFFIFGFSSPVLWGLLMIVAALVPFVGTALVWVPAGVITLIISIVNSEGSGIIKSLAFMLYGTLIISGVDNIIKPRIIGSKSNVHPVIILLGVLGGISLFGIMGIIFGPLLLALLITFIDIMNKERDRRWI